MDDDAARKETKPGNVSLKPKRAYFAAGEYITRFEPGDPQEILIDAPREKNGWKARTPETHTRAIFPGTAVQIDGQFYEIMRCEQTFDPGARFLYYLSPWQDSFPLRVHFTYTKEACEKEAAGNEQERADSLTRLLLTMVSPIVGLLPAPDQLAIQNKYGMSALRCTMLSIFFILLVSVCCGFGALLHLFAPEDAATWPVLGQLSPLLLLLIAGIFGMESLMRLISAQHDEPSGSFLLSLPIMLVRSMKHARSPEAQKQKFESLSENASTYLNARDRIRFIDESDLEVISILPKPDWGPAVGIRYKEQWYGCIDSEKAGAEYRFVLRKANEGTVFRTTGEYDEYEVRERYRAKRKQDLGTWVDTFAPLWGLLERDDQKRLQEIYGFNALKYTSWTIAALLVVGMGNAFASITKLTSGIGTLSDFVLLAFGGYLLLENILRLKQWFQKEPSGSVLHFIIQPLAAILLNP